MKYPPIFALSILLIFPNCGSDRNKNIESTGAGLDELKKIPLEILDTLLNSYVDDGKISGGVALVARKGELLYHNAFGQSNLERNKKSELDDIFRIASMTKQITAVAAMMLYEEGKFGLDDLLKDHIPEFANPVVLDSVNMSDSTFVGHPAKNDITIRQLFTHTSGLGYGFQDDKLMTLFDKAGISEGFDERPILLADNTRKLGSMPILHEPGEQWTYGVNTDVLGYLVEIWSGQTLDIFFDERIFQPLGMKDAHFYLPEEKFDRLVKV